jgi:hypothetical protein
MARNPFGNYGLPPQFGQTNPFQFGAAMDVDEYGRPRRKRQATARPQTPGMPYGPMPGAAPQQPLSFTQLLGQQAQATPKAPTFPQPTPQMSAGSYSMMGDSGIAPPSVTAPGTGAPKADTPATTPPATTPPSTSPPGTGGPGTSGFIPPVDPFTQTQAAVRQALQKRGINANSNYHPYIQALMQRSRELMNAAIGEQVRAGTGAVESAFATTDASQATLEAIMDRALRGEKVFGQGAAGNPAGSPLWAMESMLDPAHYNAHPGAANIAKYFEEPENVANFVGDIAYGGQSNRLQDIYRNRMGDAIDRYVMDLQAGQNVEDPNYRNLLGFLLRGAGRPYIGL